MAHRNGHDYKDSIHDANVGSYQEEGEWEDWDGTPYGAIDDLFMEADDDGEWDDVDDGWADFDGDGVPDDWD